ncbi:MAG: VWA domain-containing protein [Planctomycetota bacterium]
MMLAENNNWLTWLLGDDPGRVGTPRLQWGNLPESWGVFVLIAIIAAIVFAVVWMYRNEINTCPTPVKLVMAGLRLAVLLLLVILFLQPMVFYQQVNEIKPTIALLRDKSLSINRGDEYRSRDQVNQLAKVTGLSADEIESGSATRGDLINQAFATNPELVKQLRIKGALQLVDFSDGNEQVGLIPAIAKRETDAQEDEDKDDPETEDQALDTIPNLTADGLGTDLWQAVRDSLDDASRMSAIVLISEGQHNGSEDPIEIARKAADQGVPIFVVGVGDPNPPMNLEVVEVIARDKAYPDEPFEVEAVIQSTQLGDDVTGRMIDVELVQQKLDEKSGKPGVPTVVATTQVKIPEVGGRMRVDLEHTQNEPGKYVFSVQVPELDGETETDDNTQISKVITEVVDAKVRLLLISGLPSWDYQQVSRLLLRDSTIKVSCWLQSMDETRRQESDPSLSPLTKLPRTQAELNEYDVIILMDPNQNEFDAEWITMLKRFCEDRAGGLLFMAGPQFAGEFVTLNRLNKIRDLLPVRLGDDEFIETTQVLASAKDVGPGKMLPIGHNMDHPVMAFRSDPAQTQAIWDLMPGIYWNFPAIAPKPTGQVLLERGDTTGVEGNQPLMVAGRYGKGSVLYMGFQGTYRWRPIGVQAQYFDRFWIQVVRFLVETRSLQQAKRGRIDTDKSEFELGERIEFFAEILDADYRPSTKPTQDVLVVSQDDNLTYTATLKLVPNSEGRYEGSFDAQRLGSYEASIKAVGEEAESIGSSKFRIVPPSAEANAFWLNEKLLMEIAKQSGGEYLPLHQIDQLPEKLPVMITRAEFNSPPKPLWDAANMLRWMAYLLPVILLTCEWILRKWYKLL